MHLRDVDDRRENRIVVGWWLLSVLDGRLVHGCEQRPVHGYGSVRLGSDGRKRGFPGFLSLRRPDHQDRRGPESQDPLRQAPEAQAAEANSSMSCDDY